MYYIVKISQTSNKPQIPVITEAAIVGVFKTESISTVHIIK